MSTNRRGRTSHEKLQKKLMAILDDKTVNEAIREDAINQLIYGTHEDALRYLEIERMLVCGEFRLPLSEEDASTASQPE